LGPGSIREPVAMRPLRRLLGSVGELAMSVGVLLSLILAGGLTPVSQAAFSGRDGRIAFVWDPGYSVVPQSCGDVFTVNSDGSDVRRVTTGCPEQYSDPTFSADGKRLAVVGGPIPTRSGVADIFVMDAHGSHVRRVKGSIGGEEPAFSPSGRSIVFDRFVKRKQMNLIFRVNVDGSGLRRLTHKGFAYAPTFSPDGKEIAFAKIDRRGSVSPGSERVDIYIMRADGSDVRQLTHAPDGSAYGEPDFSPSGRTIVFLCGGGAFPEVCLVRADGTHLEHLTRPGRSGFSASDPVFSPAGEEIAFVGQNRCTPHGGCGNHPVVLYIMRPDGSRHRKVYVLGSRQSLGSESISWQPLR
jgi:Tol biopolymer transport system component